MATGTTTTYNFPYPVLTDPVNVHEDIQSLAERIENVLTASTTTALGVGSVELGHATDTTIARASAGVVSIEGNNILTSATGALTAGGSTITVASGTTVPLTIQNNGTGNSFVVNDVASDTTPFVIDSAGNVGIGNTPSGTYKVEVTGSVAATSSYASSAAFVGTNASTGSAGILRVTSSSGVNYIQSGLNTTGGSAAPLIFGSINNANQWMQISETGAVTIGGNPINGTWSTYTPTYTNFTLGNGTVDVARYSQVGKIVCLALQITMGTTSSVTGLIRISLPVTAASTATNTLQGGCQLNDSGSAIYSGVSALSSTTQVALYTLNSSATYLTRANTSATVPHTWASTDVFSALIFYEAA